MSTITKESAQQIFLGNGPEPTASEERELARIALASLEAEPVALRDERSGSGGISKKPGFNDLQHGTPLYTAPPAPVSVPDERYQHLSELYHAQEKRLFKLAQRIKGASFDKYAYSPSQAIDVLESAIFGEREDECRAAILHGADRPQNEPQNIPENIPATQFEPVADLYGLTSPTGGETSFTFDAVEARDFIDGGWSCQEYVELGRFQEAMLQNGSSPAQSDCCPEQNYIAPAQDGDSPVIPDGWVACSERMPGRDYVLAADFSGKQYPANLPNIQIGIYADWFDNGCPCWDEGDGNDLYLKQVTHWAQIPVAPQQEVK
ncbi:DUF551 domain-containing protein [Enterobacter hormaechei]|uniref:DUF551 domain-containing protein n=1 Tax=Enterobacter hormaechei TaxID=158836 RepID=UPI0039059CB9